jgi:hypothetical protein
LLGREQLIVRQEGSEPAPLCREMSARSVQKLSAKRNLGNSMITFSYFNISKTDWNCCEKNHTEMGNYLPSAPQ